MLQIIEQSDSEKMAMYMKLTKGELIEMLIQANKHLDSFKPQIECNFYRLDTNTTGGNCINCGKASWEHQI